jgi:hypothetical protein
MGRISLCVLMGSGLALQYSLTIYCTAHGTIVNAKVVGNNNRDRPRFISSLPKRKHYNYVTAIR